MQSRKCAIVKKKVIATIITKKVKNNILTGKLI